LADLGFTAILLSSIFFVIRQQPSELPERNSTKTGHMLGSKCNLKMHARNTPDFGHAFSNCTHFRTCGWCSFQRYCPTMHIEFRSEDIGR